MEVDASMVWHRDSCEEDSCRHDAALQSRRDPCAVASLPHCIRDTVLADVASALWLAPTGYDDSVAMTEHRAGDDEKSVINVYIYRDNENGVRHPHV